MNKFKKNSSGRKTGELAVVLQGLVWQKVWQGEKKIAGSACKSGQPKHCSETC